MTDNPFEGLGTEGGFDLQGLLQQAQHRHREPDRCATGHAGAAADGAIRPMGPKWPLVRMLRKRLPKPPSRK